MTIDPWPDPYSGPHTWWRPIAVILGFWLLIGVAVGLLWWAL